VRKIIELELDQQERTALHACALSMARQIDLLEEFSALKTGKISDAY